MTCPVTIKPKVYLTQGGLLIVAPHPLSSSTTPPIKSTTQSPESQIPPLPPSSSYLSELGVNQSFVGGLHVVTDGLASWPGQLSSISRQTGWGGRVGLGGGEGDGYHVVRPGIQSDAGWNSGGH